MNLIKRFLPWAGALDNCTEDFAEAAVKLYQDQQQWQTCQDNGFAIVSQRFDKAFHQQQLLERLLATQENLVEHRLNNFTGAMLRHHNHKSTQYMSQWIEAKNQLPSGD